MASSLFGNQPKQAQMQMNNPLQMFKEIQDFSKQIQGKGDPEALAKKFAQDHGMSQSDFDQVIEQAKGIAQMFGGFGMRM